MGVEIAASIVADREVLTLLEAASYLRVSEEELLDLALRLELPGRKIGDEWRFLKQALAGWLRQSSAKERLLRHGGIAKDDQALSQMLMEIYHERGRPMTEDDA